MGFVHSVMLSWVRVHVSMHTKPMLMIISLPRFMSLQLNAELAEIGTYNVTSSN